MNADQLQLKLNQLSQLSQVGANLASIIAVKEPEAVLKDAARQMSATLYSLYHELFMADSDWQQLVATIMQKRQDARAALLASAKQRIEDWKANQAPTVWKQWHKRAMDLKKGLNDTPYILALVDAIPCSDCKSDFAKLLAQNKPAWESPDFDYFTYTFNLHNAVNEKLGKPILKVIEAAAKYVG